MSLGNKFALVLLAASIVTSSACSRKREDENLLGLRDGGAGDSAMPADLGTSDGGRPDSGSCSQVSVTARVERKPVDIIWVVDNSTSMEPAIRAVTNGINDFAASIGDRDLDYRVIMLSLRGRGMVGSRYGVCVPEPLAGDSDCGDGERFFQVEVDIKSTQPLEQFLGTLGQTTGYTEDDSIGSAPWVDLLRRDAKKNIVVVTDDNARTCDVPHTGGSCSTDASASLRNAFDEDYLSYYPGGVNPFNPGQRSLPPGLLEEAWGDLFRGYTFSAIYGWGSASNPDVRCEYSSGDEPPSSGPTYTALVDATGGVRAKICDGAGAWGPFFDGIADTVAANAEISCDIEIPEPPVGMAFDPNAVNVEIVGGATSTTIPKVRRSSECDTENAWYYDDDQNPQRVRLCPAACDFARDQVQNNEEGGVTVQFGCESILL